MLATLTSIEAEALRARSPMCFAFSVFASGVFWSIGWAKFYGWLP
jgi:hypothetical protein